MRIDVNHPDAFSLRVEDQNGNPIERVTSVDSETGTVTFFRANDQGGIAVDEHHIPIEDTEFRRFRVVDSRSGEVVCETGEGVGLAEGTETETVVRSLGGNPVR